MFSGKLFAIVGAAVLTAAVNGSPVFNGSPVEVEEREIHAIRSPVFNGSPVEIEEREIHAIRSPVFNGSPVEVEERELQAVRSLNIPLALGVNICVGDEMQTLTILSTQRALGNVYFCVDGGYTGACEHFSVDNNVCYSVPSGFNDDISAFGPDKGIGCTLYEYVTSPVASGRRLLNALTFSNLYCRNYGCSGRSIFLGYPGNAHLAGVNFGDITSSFRCIPFN